jgi:oxygen-dependent protoporphyrinogen oxidase
MTRQDAECVPVIIVGAGITGLAAAFELAERRIPFVLLEASDRPGGLILTEKIDGFTIEAGADSLLAQKPAGVGLCEALGLAPRLIATTPPRVAYVLASGRLHALPSSAMLGIPTSWTAVARYDLLSWRGRARIALEPLVRRRGSGAGDESIAAFFRRRFGEECVTRVAEPLLGGIHAGDVERLSLRSLFPRLGEAEARRGSVLRALRRTRRSNADGAFRSLSSGMGELVTALARRLPDGSLRCGVAAAALHGDADGWRLETGRGEAFRGRAVILALPAHAASRVVSGLDAGLADLCAEVPYVSTVSVALSWPRAEVGHALAGSGFVVARTADAPRITACTWVSSKWAGRAPAGWTLLRTYMGGANDPGAIALSDEELVQISVDGISPVLGIGSPPHLSRVYRWPNAGAQHNVGHLARLERIEARLAGLPGVFAAGSGFRSIGIPDCVADGRAAAATAAQFAAARDR